MVPREYRCGYFAKQPNRAGKVAVQWALLRDRDFVFKAMGLRTYSDGSSASKKTGH